MNRRNRPDPFLVFAGKRLVRTDLEGQTTEVDIDTDLIQPMIELQALDDREHHRCRPSDKTREAAREAERVRYLQNFRQPPCSVPNSNRSRTDLPGGIPPGGLLALPESDVARAEAKTQEIHERLRHEHYLRQTEQQLEDDR